MAQHSYFVHVFCSASNEVNHFSRPAFHSHFQRVEVEVIGWHDDGFTRKECIHRLWHKKNNKNTSVSQTIAPVDCGSDHIDECCYRKPP